VDGVNTDIKPFLLDQRKGANWHSEPYTKAEIQFEDKLVVIDGCF
jgi:hypothetical protein